jgi:hypothetical protein
MLETAVAEGTKIAVRKAATAENLAVAGTPGMLTTLGAPQPELQGGRQ